MIQNEVLVFMTPFQNYAKKKKMLVFDKRFKKRREIFIGTASSHIYVNVNM